MMKNLITTTIFTFLFCSLFGQNNGKPNAFVNFDEFKKDAPSLYFDFQLKQRTDGDIFMTGGIANFRLKKVRPKGYKEKVEREIWGIKVHDKFYINSFPYSKIIGYNEIIGKGFYAYFIGEPARTEKEQRKLGIIGLDDMEIGVCCQTGYVLFPDGEIKHLDPILLLDLCSDNEDLVAEIKKANLKKEDVYEMFDFLKRYNANK